MYGIEIFKESGTTPDAGTIMCGIRTGFIKPITICDYAEWIIGKNKEKVDEYIDMLAFEGNSTEAIRCMEKHGFQEHKDSIRRLRYILLANLHSKGRKLLEDIEIIYSSFDYPEDMDSIIYYMNTDKKSSSESELITKFHNFMASEKASLRF